MEAQSTSASSVEQPITLLVKWGVSKIETMMDFLPSLGLIEPSLLFPNFNKLGKFP